MLERMPLMFIGGAAACPSVSEQVPSSPVRSSKFPPALVMERDIGECISSPWTPAHDSAAALILGACEAHLHVLRTDAFADLDEAELVSRYGEVLSPAERHKHGRFAFEEKRREYLMTRALVRTTLSRYVEVDRQYWQFGVNPHGKPFIESPKTAEPIEFNVSHTDGLIACLVARIPVIGVDVEFISHRTQILDIADQFFSRSEADALRLPSSAQRRQFYSYWTLKEAYIKARGGGFAIPLRGFSFDLGRDEIAITFGSDTVDERDAWQFALWALSASHVCAIALRPGTLTRIAVQHFESIVASV